MECPGADRNSPGVAHSWSVHVFWTTCSPLCPAGCSHRIPSQWNAQHCLMSLMCLLIGCYACFGLFCLLSRRSRDPGNKGNRATAILAATAGNRSEEACVYFRTLRMSIREYPTFSNESTVVGATLTQRTW